MVDRPTISVIVPLFNKAKHVRRCIDSILGQTFEDFEVIVVDDGSTDESPAIVEGYRDKRIVLLRQENAGPGPARNNGVFVSSGAVLSFLDADDEWLPNYLQRVHEITSSRPEVAFVILGHYYGANRAIRRHLYATLRAGEGEFRASPAWSAQQLRYAVGACHTSATAVRRGVYQRHGGFFDQTRCLFGEDHFLFLLLILCEAGYVDPEPLSWFHTEASELGLNRRTPAPPEPALLYPERLRAACPSALRTLLEKSLNREAVLAARRLGFAGKTAEAHSLLEKYPYNPRTGSDLVIDRLSVRFPIMRYLKLRQQFRRVQRFLRRKNGRHGARLR